MEFNSLVSRLEKMDRALTAAELAELLNVSRLTILRWAKRGTIPSFRLRYLVRFDSANVARWLMSQGAQP